MSLESSLGLFLDVLIVALLAAAIGFGFVLNRRLTVLRKVAQDVNGLVGGFDAATNQAKASVEALGTAGKETGRQLQDQINTARKLRDELQFLTDTGDKSLSARQPARSVGAGSAEARALELAAEVTRDAEKSAPSEAATETERELREALRYVK